MKSIITKAGLLAVAFVVCAGGPARASTIEFKVPFPFLVQGKSMPAGQYLLDKRMDGGILLRGEKGTKAGMFIMTAPPSGYWDRANQSSLTFTVAHNQHQLTDIWVDGSELGVVGSR